MWFSDFTLVLDDRLVPHGSLRVEAGRIAEIVERPVPGGVPGAGLHLLPGLVDMHGDMIEIELEPRPGVDMPMEMAVHQLDMRLAASGVTTGYAAVSFSRGAKDGARRSYEHTSRAIRGVAAARGALRIDHRIHARFDITFENAVEVLRELVDDGIVDMVSLMDHTPGQGQYRDIERHIEQVARMDGVDIEDARRFVEAKIARGTKPEAVLLANLQEVSELCRSHGVAMASHDDDSAKKVALMSDMGVVMSEFPVVMEAAEAAAGAGMMVAMGAPNALRGGSYSGNLSARDAHRAGLLHILAADYHPGAILPAVKILSETDPGGLPGAVRLATGNPAEALGLADRGRLEVGLRADLALVDFSGIGRCVASFSGERLAYSNGSLAFAERAPEAIAV